MQIKLFTIPISDTGVMQEELNRFLRSNKILEMESHLITQQNSVYWCFFIKYIHSEYPHVFQPGKNKIDYKEVLDEPTFRRFEKLRKIRKQISAEDAVPAYAVFTDEELSGLAKLECVNLENFTSVNGIGQKKMERYGERFLSRLDTDSL